MFEESPYIQYTYVLKAYHCTFSHHVRHVAHDPESHVEDSKPYPVLSNYWSFLLYPFCKGLFLLCSVDVCRSGKKPHLNKKKKKKTQINCFEGDCHFRFSWDRILPKLLAKFQLESIDFQMTMMLRSGPVFFCI